ncbi:GLPGLI family protein [Raineya orbicola]|uniref:GLPGLI: GLPGLI family protein n=1 Tax=Raineya orbicola TaxID=2016530 RepID=A0A2N3I537_9BACT|nr:GLPGLI family protein [Raineya orbicola]PKQ65416.1 GLPGLI: GLPGLI family protein [Raineya orbicola]
MKNILTVITLFLGSFQLLGQNILFEYSHKSPSGVSFYKAHVNNNYSEHFYIPEKQIHNNTIIDDKSKSTNIFFIKNKKDNYLYKTDGFSEQYYLKDTLHPMKWKFGKEKKTILGFLCKSATTTFRGRNYTAFYTENISVLDGPWKFGGLPGLILAVISEDKEYEWNVEKIIQNYKENINETQIENLLKNVS